MASNSYSVDFGGRRIIVDITETNHPETLKSTIGYSVKIRNVAGYYNYNYNNALQFRLGNDTLVNASNIRSINLDSAGQEIVLASGTWTYQHNNDGSGSFAVYAYFDQKYDDFAPAVIDSVHICTDIPRATLPQLPASAPIGSTITITLPRVNNSWTHDITYSYGALTGQTEGLSKYTGVGTSCTFTPPNILHGQIVGMPSRPCTITVTTKNGSTVIGTRTATIILTASAKPVISSVTLSEATDIPTSFGIWIRNKSKIHVQVSASAQYSSSITAVSVSFGGKTYSGSDITTDVIQSDGAMTVTVTDDRGLSQTQTQEITTYAYTTPQIAAISPQRCDADGNPADQGTYVKVLVRYSVDGIDGNSGKWRLYYKTRSSSYFSAYNDWQSADSYDGYIVMSIYNSFQLNEEYDIMLSVTDTISGESNPYSVGGRVDRADCIMEIRGDGLGVSFGQFSTGPGFQSHYNTNMFGDYDVITIGKSLGKGLLNSNLSGISTYPAEVGAYRVTGTLPAGMPTDANGYGCLFIVDGGTYRMHLYVASDNVLYVSRTTDASPQPTSWTKHSGTSVTAKT